MKGYNWLLKWSNFVAYRTFMNNINGFEKVQKAYLMNLLSQNASTDYGEKYDFKSIKTIEDYQDNVPLGNYEHHEPYIVQSMNGKLNVLTSEPILLFELSSGSTAPSKYIPYTKGLKADFMRGVQPWLFNLYQTFPKLMRGKSYWSISPVNHENHYTQSGIPIGFEEDAGYFGNFQRWLFGNIFPVPSQVKNIHDITDFRYVTMYYLLKTEDLALISVWNPSFLTLILENFECYYEQLIHDLAGGMIRPPNRSEIPLAMLKDLKPLPKRAYALTTIIKQGFTENTYSDIWPGLEIISCWDQGHASQMAQGLMKRFTNVTLQGKGLLATEGLVSVPIEGIGHVVSYPSHFFEFLPLTSEEPLTRPLLLHQLAMGAMYTVIMTTSGGLYRYPIYDIIQVIDKHKGLPIIEFIGKSTMVSDYFGEKLNGYHVQQVLAEQAGELEFVFVSPVEVEDAFSYCLYVDADKVEDFDQLISRVEEALMTNYHYAYARHLQQIQPLKGYLMKDGYEKAYYEVMAKGIRLGNIKFQPLVQRMNMHVHIPGEFYQH